MGLQSKLISIITVSSMRNTMFCDDYKSPNSSIRQAAFRILLRNPKSKQRNCHTTILETFAVPDAGSVKVPKHSRGVLGRNGTCAQREKSLDLI